ncbi:MAG: putative multidrug export ATP-binding/permease protein [Candidatus Heimdallarchaeota archaeon LC_2]|nr:MAG: putative multidrug export ATP-binding/permease protein [Candidatus Heimdallarchaeota archaeon LC_2]
MVTSFNDRDREFIPPINYNTNRTNSNRWLLSHLKRHKFLIFFGLFLQIVNITVQSIIPGLFAEMVAAYPDNLTQELITKNSRNILYLLTGVALVQLIRSSSFEIVGARLERDARDELYSELLGKNQTFHDSNNIGDLMSRVTQDVRQLSLLMNPGLNLIFMSFTFALIPIIFIGTINVKLLLTPVIFFIIFIGMVRWYNNQLSPWSAQSRMSLGTINNRLNEVITGIQVVRANTEEEFEQNIFHNNISQYHEAEVKLGQVRAKYWPNLIYGLALMGSIFHAVTLYQGDEISLDQLVEFILLFQLMRLSVLLNSFAISAVSMGIAASDRIYDIIEGKSDIDLNLTGYSNKISDSIVFDNVTFAYTNAQSNKVLDNISFRVESGQTIALVGVTGSGKSTIAKLISRLYDPDEGRILIDNVNLKDWSIESLRSQMAIVEQDVFLFSRSVSDNIRFGLENITQEQIVIAAKQAQAHEFILQLTEGYDTQVGERGATLSGGQKQRIAIARAIVRDPKILILDDSSSAIDSKTEDEINNAIKNVVSGRIAFIITHRIAQIRRADQIVLLDQGKIIAKGDHNYMLLHSDKYREIFSIFDEVSN